MGDIGISPDIAGGGSMLEMLRSGQASRLAGRAEADEQKKLQEAGKGFEALLVGKLIDSMRKSIPDSGLLEDSASKQVEDMFWHFMGEEIGNQGGIGLWKELVAEAKGMGPSSDNVPVGDGKEHPDDHGMSTKR